MESLEKRLKASNEAKARLAKDKKSIAAKMTRTEGQWLTAEIFRAGISLSRALMQVRTRTRRGIMLFLQFSQHSCVQNHTPSLILRLKEGYHNGNLIEDRRRNNKSLYTHI